MQTLIRKLVLFGLIVVPVVASAQRGGGGGGRGTRGDKDADWKAITGANKGGVKLSDRDVEDISPIKLLIDKRKDLKLSDDQLKSLKTIETQLKERNDGSFRALDSLRRLTQPPLNEPTDEQKDRMMNARRMVGNVVGAIRENYDASLKEAMPLLDDSQRATATDLLGKQKKEAEDMLREKLGGRG